MITRDYHHVTLAGAIKDVDDMLAHARVTGTSVEAEFIVGHGVIRNKLITLLESYKLGPRPKLGNPGIILCTLE